MESERDMVCTRSTCARTHAQGSPLPVTLLRRLVGALLGATVFALLGAAIEVGGILIVAATHSSYSHVEERQLFPMHIALAPLGLLYGALPDHKYRKRACAAALVALLVVWAFGYRVFEIHIR